MNKTTENQRRSQSERRVETQSQILASACRLFGQHGYAETSLEMIATDCGITTRPIFHYFNNKLGLFAAVNTAMEQRILDRMKLRGKADYNWRDFLELCEDSAFRQIVLIDSPNILGRARWENSAVTQQALEAIAKGQGRSVKDKFRLQLLTRILLASYAEAALTVAEASNIGLAKKQAGDIMEEVHQTLQGLSP